MTIASMTGFARVEGRHDDLAWVWELKSVNGRSLDVRVRVPMGLDGLESVIRTRAAERFKRGNISVTLSATTEAAAPKIRINRAVLDRILALSDELKTHPGLAPPRIDGLLGLRGVIETVDEDETEDRRLAREGALLSGLDAAFAALAEARADEGKKLAVLLAEQLAEVERLAGLAAESAAAQPAAIRDRLMQRITALLGDAPGLAPDRLAQEAALLATKADVREEIDRLNAHVGAARDLMRAGGAVGRRLDFLCQEFNRESNTLCSKATDVSLTRIGLDLKACIEQIREQVQNVE
ncbi:MAG: YicC/YloC family endoribonuclease [Alphaproteobacteria bacterium]